MQLGTVNSLGGAWENKDNQEHYERPQVCSGLGEHMHPGRGWWISASLLGDFIPTTSCCCSRGAWQMELKFFPEWKEKEFPILAASKLSPLMVVGPDAAAMESF